MNWKIAAALSPLALGLGLLSSAIVQAHLYKLRRRTILLPDGSSVRETVDAQTLAQALAISQEQNLSSVPKAPISLPEFSAPTSKTPAHFKHFKHADSDSNDQSDNQNYGADSVGTKQASANSSSPGKDYAPKVELDLESIRILHISDTHLLRTQIRRKNFLRNLAAQNPDLIVFTGDLISENAAIPSLLEALEVFRGIPGVYVFGSNDYYYPRLKNPLSYLFKNSSLSKVKQPQRLDTDHLISGLDNLGFTNLNNSTAELTIGSWHLEFIGVDDPHIGFAKFPSLELFNHDRHRSNHDRHAESADGTESSALTPPPLSPTPITESAPQAADFTVRIGLTHAPYKKVLDQLSDAGCQLVFAGHTHGGQVCLPGHRALVTNCDLPTSHASGLFTWPLPTSGDRQLRQKDLPLQKNGAVIGWSPEAGRDEQLDENQNGQSIATAVGANSPTGSTHSYDADSLHVSDGSKRMLVQVSAGIGTSPFAQIRTFCPPEAIQIDIVRI